MLSSPQLSTLNCLMSQKLSKLYEDRYLDVFVMVILIISLAMYRYVGCKWALEDIKNLLPYCFTSLLLSRSLVGQFFREPTNLFNFFLFNDSTKNVCTSVLF